MYDLILAIVKRTGTIVILRYTRSQIIIIIIIIPSCSPGPALPICQFVVEDKRLDLVIKYCQRQKCWQQGVKLVCLQYLFWVLLPLAVLHPIFASFAGTPKNVIAGLGWAEYRGVNKW